MTSKTPAAPTPLYAGYALAVLMAVYVVNFMDRQILAILLEPIRKELHLTDTKLGLLSGLAFALFYATAGVPLARLADRRHRVRLISVCLGLWSVMTAACGLAQNFVQLLLARVGVAVGEAGCVPPSHSLIVDYFPPERRATALGIYSAGVPLGVLLGFLVGGWISQYFGWRTAFLAVSLPGLVLGLVLWAILREPRRRAHEAILTGAPAAPPGDTRAALMALARNPVFVQLTMAGALKSFVASGSLQWLPSYFARTYEELSLGEIGTIVAVGVGGAGLIGTLVGGWAADVLGRRDRRWYAWLPAIAMVAALPTAAGVCLTSSPLAAAALLFASNLFGLAMLGPLHALIQSSVSPDTRATASAIVLLASNALGLGVGPLVIGIVSDALRPFYGSGSLRYALLGATVVYAWATLHLLLAARHVRGSAAT